MAAVDAEKFIGELELAVDRLRSLYEQYFMGIEKLEPTVVRKDVDRRIHTLRKEQIRNTAQRFRFQMVLQRYNTYQSYWQRICREIENGTYKRHVMRARQRFGEVSAVSTSSPPQPRQLAFEELAVELADLDRELGSPRPQVVVPQDIHLAFAPAAPPKGPPFPAGPRKGLPPPLPAGANGSRQAPPVPKAPVRSSELPSGLPVAARPFVRVAPATPSARSDAVRRPDLSEDRVRELYQQYVEAKRRQNESTASVTYEAVARTLRESSARLRQKHGKTVDFEVTVKDGRAVLKPIVR